MKDEELEIEEERSPGAVKFLVKVQAE